MCVVHVRSSEMFTPRVLEVYADALPNKIAPIIPGKFSFLFIYFKYSCSCIYSYCCIYCRNMIYHVYYLPLDDTSVRPGSIDPMTAVVQRGEGLCVLLSFLFHDTTRLNGRLFLIYFISLFLKLKVGGAGRRHLGSVSLSDNWKWAKRRDVGGAVCWNHTHQAQRLWCHSSGHALNYAEL